MNPSANGWITKFLKDIDQNPLFQTTPIISLYEHVKNTGFVYGTSIYLFYEHDYDLDLSEEEKTKVNLLASLIIVYHNIADNESREDCINKIIEFYNFIDNSKSLFSFFNTANDTLERIIHTRIQTNESIFRRNFSHLFTNALLFIDVLAFKQYLSQNSNPLSYATQLERTITNTVFCALNSKDQKNTYDELVLKLLTSSIRYNEITEEDEHLAFEHLFLERYQDPIEKQYILDLTSLALWNDGYIDPYERQFVYKLGHAMHLSKEAIQYSFDTVHAFIEKHKTSISFYNYSNPARHFYNQSIRSINLLILRNKKRLIKEISQSKELMILLHQSTQRNLSSKEKQLVKNQLLDICKTIPSLAIFIIPGGSFILPVLVKFIPQLLPSAFNENHLQEYD